MAHRKLTAEEVAELIMADQGESEGELSGSDCSVADIDLHQPIILMTTQTQLIHRI